MDIASRLCKDYARVEKAIRYIAENFTNHPGLPEIAANVFMSEYHFQRLFTRWGVERKTALIGWEASHCPTPGNRKIRT